MAFSSKDWLCINTLRTLSIDAIQKANSGHPGLPLGAAPMAWVLWHRHLRHVPQAPHWPDRDRFILSGGHGSMLLYSLLHLFGYDLSLDDLRAFRQWESRTPGHPEAFLTPGVEATTGPLGQGAANAVGMAMAERAMAARFNKPGRTLVDHFTYALVTDGDVMEGVALEAASLAGHLRLGKLIYLYDANDISLDGPTSITFTEDVGKRYEACGWHVQTVADGNTDLDAIDLAITAAKADPRPSMIVVKTTIGFGAPNKQGTSSVHGSPLGDAELALTKKALGWNHEPFHVPAEAREHARAAVVPTEQRRVEWDQTLSALEKFLPAEHQAWVDAIAGELPEGWDAELPTWEPGAKVATRTAAGKAMNALARRVPTLLGGDADLSCSTNTAIEGGGSFTAEAAGRNVHYGVREHAMGAIANGMAYHQGVRTFVATFFCFSDYMRPAVRLAALNHLPVIYVWTHDSVGLGEDGPTHQPVEHLMSLRCMPHLWMVRPGDANEAAQAWRMALLRKDGPVGLVLSRQALPVLAGTKEHAAQGVVRGAYVLRDPAGGRRPLAILMASGSELELAVTAHERLAVEGIATRVVSMPCWERFSQTDVAYRQQVLPRDIVARVAIEAGVTLGWERWVGDHGRVLGVDRFGASAPAEQIYRHYGLTVDALVAAVHERLAALA